MHQVLWDTPGFLLLLDVEVNEACYVEVSVSISVKRMPSCIAGPYLMMIYPGLVHEATCCPGHLSMWLRPAGLTRSEGFV